MAFNDETGRPTASTAGALAESRGSSFNLPSSEPYWKNPALWGCVITIIGAAIGLFALPFVNGMTRTQSAIAFTYVSLVCLGIFLGAECWRLSKLNAILRAQPPGAPNLYIEGEPLTSLTGDLLLIERTINQVLVEESHVEVKWVGPGPVHDAEVTNRLRGINLSLSEDLVQLRLVIYNHHFVPWSALNAKYFDLKKDPNRSNPLKFAKPAKDSISKPIELVFCDPVAPMSHFDVELSFTWPAYFSGPKNYCYAHALDFKKTKRLVLEVDTGSLQKPLVKTYWVASARGTMKWVLLGLADQDETRKQTYKLEMNDPVPDAAYLMFVDSA